VHWFQAARRDGAWQDWQAVDFDPAWQVGELHFSADGNTLYFASSRPGGAGGMDLWLARRTGEAWGEPENLAAVNSASDEGWPALSPDETELWFYRDYATWRSLWREEAWQAPEKMFSPLAGEPTIDAAGNVYLVHHFFEGERMLEADIYLAQRK
jgi:hypothetical protein